MFNEWIPFFDIISSAVFITYVIVNRHAFNSTYGGPKHFCSVFCLLHESSIIVHHVSMNIKTKSHDITWAYHKQYENDRKAFYLQFHRLLHTLIDKNWFTEKLYTYMLFRAIYVETLSCSQVFFSSFRFVNTTILFHSARRFIFYQRNRLKHYSICQFRLIVR